MHLMSLFESSALKIIVLTDIFKLLTKLLIVVHATT